MTIFDALRQDHDVQRTVLDRLTSTQGDSRKRDELFARARAELQDHAAAEERFFYVPLMEFDMTQEKARHSVAEHHEIDELIEELDGTDYSSPGWLAAAKRLKDLVLHHLEEEEQQVFQLAGRVLSDKQKRTLGEHYRTEKGEMAD